MNTTQITLPVTGMHCVNCAAGVERTLMTQVDGVVNASVNFAVERVAVEYIPSATTPTEMAKAVKKAGFTLILNTMPTAPPTATSTSKGKSGQKP